MKIEISVLKRSCEKAILFASLYKLAVRSVFALLLLSVIYVFEAYILEWGPYTLRQWGRDSALLISFVGLALLADFIRFHLTNFLAYQSLAKKMRRIDDHEALVKDRPVAIGNMRIGNFAEIFGIIAAFDENQLFLRVPFGSWLNFHSSEIGAFKVTEEGKWPVATFELLSGNSQKTVIEIYPWKTAAIASL